MFAENVIPRSTRGNPLEDDFHADARTAHNRLAAKNGRIRCNAVEHEGPPGAPIIVTLILAFSTVE
jgi:hypothetical protein